MGSSFDPQKISGAGPVAVISVLPARESRLR